MVGRSHNPGPLQVASCRLQVAGFKFQPHWHGTEGWGWLSGVYTRDTVTNECLQGVYDFLPVTLPVTIRDQPVTK